MVPSRFVFDKEVKQLCRKMVPGIIGGGIVQINLWIDVLIGTLIPSAIAYLYYADRLSQLPLAIIGTALGTVLLPTLSKYIKTGKRDAAMNALSSSLEVGMFFVLPATAAFIVISEPLMATLFERGEFTSSATQATAYALIAYAIGLPAYTLIKLFSPLYFASGDTKTPVKVGVMSLVINTSLNIIFIKYFPIWGLMPHIGIAVATSIASWFNAILLITILYKKDMVTIKRSSVIKVLRISLISVVMAFALNFSLQAYQQPIAGMDRVVHLATMVFIGAFIYISLVFVTKTISLDYLKKSLKVK